MLNCLNEFVPHWPHALSLALSTLAGLTGLWSRLVKKLNGLR